MQQVLEHFAGEILTGLSTLLLAWIKMKLDKKRIRRDLKKFLPNGEADFITR